MNIIIINKKQLLKYLICFLIILNLLIVYKDSLINVFNELTPDKYQLINSINTSDKKIAFTFEINGHTKSIDELLNLLKEKNVNGTFFITGNWAKEHASTVRKIHENGHEIENHTLTHTNVNFLKSSDLKSEINSCEKILNNIIGIKTKLVKLPEGSASQELLKTVYDSNYLPINCTIESDSYKELGSDNTISSIINSKLLSNGSIINFTVGTGDLEIILDKLIDQLLEENYTFSTLDGLLYKENYYIDSKGTQKLNS